MDEFPQEVQQMLKQASSGLAGPVFRCQVFADDETNEFVELWSPKIYSFVQGALGPYGTHPKAVILPLTDADHIAGANASFNILTGQVRLGTHLSGQYGVLLEKITHEFTHGSMAKFPEGDPFYEEGMAADYVTWVMAHAPCWGPFREAMIDAASDNIRLRRERAFSTRTDYDKKRWAGGLYASLAYGPHIIAMLKMKKLEGDFTW